MPSLTQTALLHVQGPRVDRERLRSYLGIYQSSSPSYVLMAAMDRCVSVMREQGEQLFDVFTARLEQMRKNLQKMKTLHLVDGTEEGLQAFAFDRSKVLIALPETIHFASAQMTGPKLAQILRETYHLEVEMAAQRYVTAIMTVCDTEEGFERLEHALLEIDQTLTEKAAGKKRVPVIFPHNDGVMTIEEAWNAPGKVLPLQESGQEISAEFVYLYPPGIPFLVPGERIPEDLPKQLQHFQEIGLHLQGLADKAGRMIRIVDRDSNGR
jgi:arginine/lysine/ornithine decarboxylase